MCSKKPLTLKQVVVAAVAAAGSACTAHHSARGVVLGVDAPKRILTVSHDAVPGYMEAMAMPFEAAPGVDLAGVTPGDRIGFRIGTRGARTRIDRLQMLSAAPPGSPPLAPGGSSRGVRIGQAVPDFTLTTHRGGTLTLSSLRGRTVALAFIYTRCPLPDYCPRLMTNFAAVKRRFASRLERDLVLVTVTFDPQYDTPDTLTRYARRYDADGPGWHFLTGSKAAVGMVCELFGVEFWPEEGLITHTLRTAVIDREGRLAATVEGRDYSGKQLGDLVESVLDQGRTMTLRR